MTRHVTDVDPAQQYEVYRLCECSACDGTGKISDYPGDLDERTIRCNDCRGEGRTRELVAACGTPEALGVALVTLGKEGEWEGCPIGIMHRLGEPGERWLVRPWLPSARNVSAAGRTLAQSKSGKGKK